MRLLSIVGGLAGLVFIILSAVRYYALYPDLDKLIAYLSIGVLIMACSYLYDKYKTLEGKFDYFEDKVQDMVEEK